MNIEDLTPEQIEKAKVCKTVEELGALAESEDVKLSNEQFEAISGGGVDWDCILEDCPHY